jgi:hypothetical protein
MPDLDFKVTSVEAASRGLTPLLHFHLDVRNQPETEVIQAVLLHAQVQIQSPQRAYNEREKERLGELFGTPERWGQTLRNRLWTHTQATLGTFAGSARTILPIQCTYDLNVIATKFIYALEGGEVPLLFLFSGSVFYTAENGLLQVQQISWNTECTYPLPVRVWQELMEHHFPNTAWLCLQRDLFDRLYAFKRSHGLATWEQTIERLLLAVGTEEVAA